MAKTETAIAQETEVGTGIETVTGTAGIEAATGIAITVAEIAAETEIGGTGVGIETAGSAAGIETAGSAAGIETVEAAAGIETVVTGAETGGTGTEIGIATASTGRFGLSAVESLQSFLFNRFCSCYIRRHCIAQWSLEI